jgi:uncharacterized protein (DUF488 family)
VTTKEGEIVYTIGHSDRTLEELVSLLDERRIETLVDVRRNPWSRRHPHFCRTALQRALEGHRLRYLHVEALGGHRDAVADSPNTALPKALRGYADHMSTPVFRRALEGAMAEPAPVAFMCAEAMPSNCHRSILSDELVRLGHRVVHILGPDRESTHVLDPRSVDEGSRLIYPSGSSRQLSLPLD